MCVCVSGMKKKNDLRVEYTSTQAQVTSKPSSVWVCLVKSKLTAGSRQRGSRSCRSSSCPPPSPNHFLTCLGGGGGRGGWTEMVQILQRMSDCLAPLRDEENPLETRGDDEETPPTCNWTLRPRRGHASTNTHTHAHTVTTLTLPFPPPNKARIDEVKLQRGRAERTGTRVQTATGRDSFNAANPSLPVKYEAFSKKLSERCAV